MNDAYNINTDYEVRTRPYFTLRDGKPFIEYLHGNPTGNYIVSDRGNLTYFASLSRDEEDVSINREYRELVDAQVVSCPRDLDGRMEMTDLWEMCRDWLKTVVAFGSDLELTTAASYAVLTWFIWRYHSLPYLRFIGDYGTGKTTALRALSAISYRSLNLSGAISAAALFRVINEVQGTLLIDEADFKGSGLESQIVKILNHGYTNGVSMIRLNRKNKPQAFQAFGPKIIATRLPFVDSALESRCLNITMTPRSVDGLAELHEQQVVKRAHAITSGLLYWRLKSSEMKGDWALFDSASGNPARGYEPRVGQLAAPLFECTPRSRRRELELYFDAVNSAYLNAQNNGAEAQVRRILRQELNALNHKLTLAQLYRQLSYGCRLKHSSRKISRIAEVLGCEKRRGKDGVVFWFPDGVV